MKLFNLPVRQEAEVYYGNPDFAKKNTENIIDQTERGKVRGMKPYELTVFDGRPVVLFLLPDAPQLTP
jgi:hypothetical protein